MSGRTRIIVAVSIVTGLVIPGVCSAVKPRSTSTSRQFIVYGNDPRVRGAICDLAERTKSHLLHLMELRDNWKTPLVVKLDYPEANIPEVSASRLEMSQLGYGLKLQLNLVLTREVKVCEFQRELLRAVLIEIMYRDRSDLAAGTPYVEPPDWLLDGILALQPGVERDQKSQLLLGFVTQNRIASLNEVVTQKRDQLDSSSRKLYEAYCLALIELLAGAPDSRRKLTQYIRNLPAAPNDTLTNLRVYFPETLGRASEKWWALAVARLSAADRYELLNAAETSAQLDRLLRVTIATSARTAKQYSLGEYAQFSRFPAHRTALERIGQQLRVLSVRAHPLYQSIVQEEYAVVTLLLRGKAHDLTNRLHRITIHRAAIERQARAIDDYLNWYEATQLKSLSGAFTEILKSPDNQRQSRRRDPISVYLDSIEIEIER